MHEIKIFGNDLKSLLLLKWLKNQNYSSKIFADPGFNFDTSYLFNGQIFDCGYHAIEINRDPEVWKLLNTEKIELNRFRARRALFINGRKVWRNYSLKALDDNLLSESFDKSIEDAVLYFKKNYVFGQFIPSYTQNLIWRDIFQLSEKEYLVNIEPWFYPNELLTSVERGIKYHFENQENADNVIAYPKENGFGAIQQSLRESLSHLIFPKKNDIYVPKTLKEIHEINKNAELESSIYVMPIDIMAILNSLGEPVKVCPTNYLIVDVELWEPISIDWSEMLVADPRIKIDRISSSEFLSGSSNASFIQIEKEIMTNDDHEKIEDTLLKDLRELFRVQGVEIKVKSTQCKKIPFKRFDNEKCAIKVQNLIAQIELEFRNIIILNRSLLYRNFVDTFKDLKCALETKVVI